MHQIYLIGTDHRYQRGFAFGVPDNVFVEFRALLQSAIARYGIRGIAEEMQVNALRISSGSVAFHLAKDLGLAHRYCDPDLATRQARAMNAPQDRERYAAWLKQHENDE